VDVPRVEPSTNMPEVFPTRGSRSGQNKTLGVEKRREEGEVGNAMRSFLPRVYGMTRNVIDRALTHELI